MNIIGTVKRLVPKAKVKELKGLIELKQEQKELATKLTGQKKALKESHRAYGRGEEGAKPWNEEYKKDRMKYEFRHKHIAYCLLRGTEMEKIEQPAEDNKPSEKRIKEIMEEYKNEKDVCYSEE